MNGTETEDIATQMAHNALTSDERKQAASFFKVMRTKGLTKRSMHGVVFELSRLTDEV